MFWPFKIKFPQLTKMTISHLFLDIYLALFWIIDILLPILPAASIIYWINIFITETLNSVPLLQVYKITYFAWSVALKTIVKELFFLFFTEFEHGAVIGCHHCNSSVCEVSSMVDISQSTVSCIIAKWSCIRSSRVWKVTERGRWVLRYKVANTLFLTGRIQWIQTSHWNAVMFHLSH